MIIILLHITEVSPIIPHEMTDYERPIDDSEPTPRTLEAFGGIQLLIDGFVQDAEAHALRNPDYLYVLYDTVDGEGCEMLNLSKYDQAHYDDEGRDTAVDLLIPEDSDGQETDHYYFRLSHRSSSKPNGIIKVEASGVTVMREGELGFLQFTLSKFQSDEEDNFNMGELVWRLSHNYIPQPQKEARRYQSDSNGK